MKELNLLGVGAIIGCGLTLLLLWFVPGDDSPCLQQQAGYQAVVTSQTNLLQTQIDLLAKEKARAGLLQALHTALQEEFAGMLAARVGKFDDVMEGPEAIAILAKRLAPVERAVKMEATDNHEFIPAAFRTYWGKVLASGLMRGK